MLVEVSARYGNTLALTLMALAWSTIAGVLLGVWSGRNRSNWQDYTGMTLAVSGISLPSFWVGFMLIMVFCREVWLVAHHGCGLTARTSICRPSHWESSIAAIIARFTRSSIIEVLKDDYIRTARAKGLRGEGGCLEACVPQRMISVVTVVGLQFGFLLGGSVVTESVFAFPGLGSLLVESVNYRDYPAIQSLILIFSLHFVVINLIVDVLYAVLNPEIQLTKKGGV